MGVLGRIKGGESRAKPPLREEGREVNFLALNLPFLNLFKSFRIPHYVDQWLSLLY